MSDHGKRCFIRRRLRGLPNVLHRPIEPTTEYGRFKSACSDQGWLFGGRSMNRRLPLRSSRLFAITGLVGSSE